MGKAPTQAPAIVTRLIIFTASRSEHGTLLKEKYIKMEQQQLQLLANCKRRILFNIYSDLLTSITS